ncbi:MAG TPA: hypothetical protein PLZ21_00025 [Armatimonadota bacterium]|nr:hypothetical protein [Armatimonadota bacterium]
MARRGRKRNISMPSRAEALMMQLHGIKLTDEEPLSGYLEVKYTRHSNRPNCRCNTKGELHGPYYYRVWYEEIGRTPWPDYSPILKRRKQFIPLADVPKVLARLRQFRIDKAPFFNYKGVLKPGFSISNPMFRAMMFGYHPLCGIRPRDLRRRWSSE